MDHHLRSLPVEAHTDVVGRVEVELRTVPRDRPGRTRERCIRQGGDEVPAETSGRPRDGDAHQSPVAGMAGAAWPVASRCPYWRAYQPSQSPDRAARHHASFAWYQATVEARPSSKRRRRAPAERRELRAVHRVPAVVAGPVVDRSDE